MERMHQLADEIRETFEERGHRIDQAVQLDSAFNATRRPRSSLGRALVLDAIEAAASRLGLGYKTVSGGACDVVDVADRRFRVRKAEIDPQSGAYKIIAASDSILTVTDAEPESLLRVERWVLGYTVDAEGLVADIFGARVLGISDDAVPQLQLGSVTPLGTGGFAIPPSGGGFRPDDEDDLGDNDLDQSDYDDGTGESSAS